MLGNHVLHQHVAAGGGNGGQVSTRLDLVGDDGIGAAAQGVDAPDLDGIGARAGNARAHGIEEVGQVHDVGFLGGVFNDGLAGEQGRGDHDVHRRAHRRHVQADPIALQAVGPGLQGHIVLGLLHLRAQGQEALDVLVDGAGGKAAPAGQRHMGPAEAAEQRAHEIIAGADLLHQVLVGLGAVDGGAVDLHHVRAGAVNVRAHSVQNVQQDTHVGNIGNILNAALSADQQRRGQDGHGCVLRAADGDGPVQRVAAVDFIYCQG